MHIKDLLIVLSWKNFFNFIEYSLKNNYFTIYDYILRIMFHEWIKVSMFVNKYNGYVVIFSNIIRVSIETFAKFEPFLCLCT